MDVSYWESPASWLVTFCHWHECDFCGKVLQHDHPQEIQTVRWKVQVVEWKFVDPSDNPEIPNLPDGRDVGSDVADGHDETTVGIND